MIYPHCVFGNKNHSRFSWTEQFIYSISTQLMFHLNGHRQVGRHGRLHSFRWKCIPQSIKMMFKIKIMAWS